MHNDEIFINQIVTPNNVTVEQLSGNNTLEILSQFYLGTDLKLLSANWQSTYLTVCGLSADWETAYTYITQNSSFLINQEGISNFVINNSANIINVDTTVNLLSSNWETAYTYVTEFSGIEEQQEQATSLVVSSSANWNTSYTSLSTLTYENINANVVYSTIQEYAASNPSIINKGSTVELSNGRVYVFAGTDVTNPSHYLEVNSNPIYPIYKELSIYNQNQALVDSFNVTDFKSSKYTLQVETNFNNEIYYSEINILGSVDSQLAVASEYGQISTSNIILGYIANFNVNQIELWILFSSELVNPNRKLILKGHRTNFYKI